jgi:hypothetical protein
MAGITALGTTYNLPNYTGQLFQLTPADTPFFSAIGGLNGGGQTTDTEFEWEVFDLRTMAQPAVLEGQDAPTEQGRVRAQVKNVVQIHHETIGVSYTKQAATGRKAGLANDGVNPVLDEVDWQLIQMLKQMTRDANYSLINGVYQLPSDNTTARKTRGLFAAVTTNALDGSATVPNGAGASATAATDLIAATGHGLAVNDQINFTSVGAATPLTTNTVYYVSSDTFTANSFKVSTTRGGTAVNITVDGTVTFRKRQVLTKALIDDLMQAAYDNGGLTEGDASTLLVSSAQRRAVSSAYATAGNYVTKELAGNIGGVRVDRIDTDFGPINVMLDRAVPADKLAVVSMEQCRPVFLEIPARATSSRSPSPRPAPRTALSCTARSASPTATRRPTAPTATSRSEHGPLPRDRRLRHGRDERRRGQPGPHRHPPRRRPAQRRSVR